MDNNLSLDELLEKLSSYDNKDKSKYVKDPKPPKDAEKCLTRDDIENQDRWQDIELKKKIFSHVVGITYIWILQNIISHHTNGVLNVFFN